MSCTIEKILADARLLVNRLKDHDSCADSLISSTNVLHKRIDAMKQVDMVFEFEFKLFKLYILYSAT